MVSLVRDKCVTYCSKTERYCARASVVSEDWAAGTANRRAGGIYCTHWTWTTCWNKWETETWTSIRAPFIDISLTVSQLRGGGRYCTHWMWTTCWNNNYKIGETDVYNDLNYWYKLSLIIYIYITIHNTLCSVIYCVIKSNTCEISVFFGEDPSILHGAGFDMTSSEKKE